MTAGPFQVRITVRTYELDAMGHLNSAVYHQYGEHARWEFLRAGGVEVAGLLDSGVGPVLLETTIRYRNELRAGDEVDISCIPNWDGDKTFRIDEEFRRPDGTLVAEVDALGGLLDLATRRLVTNPGKHIRSHASAPELIGL
jgi:acyl-CoA thioester hydrolase